MMISFFRTAILYLFIIFAFRLMGKRQIGQLSPTELVVAMMISDLASSPAQNNSLPLLAGMVPILSLIVMEILLSFLSMKSASFHRLLSGRSVVIMRDGRVIEKEMEKLRFNLDDLLEEIRVAGYADIGDVDMVVLESGGKISIVPKKEKAPLTAEDAGVRATPETPSTILIADGKLRRDRLREIGVDEKWVYKTLQKHKIKDIKDCFLFTADKEKNALVQAKEKKER